MKDMTFFGQPEAIQEAYNASSSGYKDLFDGKFNSFDSSAIVSQGNNALKTGSESTDMDLEQGNLALGYKNSAPGFSPKPGKFFD